jgi:hypothetical protein
MTAVNEPVQIVMLTPRTAEVRLCAGRDAMRIGRVGSSNGRWFWQHRDGEQSSPVAVNRSDAANALADYHRTFKLEAGPAPSKHRLLFD